MKTYNITIKDKEYKLKNTVRALFIFEQIKGEAFAINTITDSYVYMYSMLLANNPDMDLSWDDFINALDDDPTIYENFNKIVTDIQNTNKILDRDSNKEDSKKA